MKNKSSFRKELKALLVEHTGGCSIQDGWPCGTCTCALLSTLINPHAKEYKEHNKPVDRINEVWRYIIQARER